MNHSYTIASFVEYWAMYHNGTLSENSAAWRAYDIGQMGASRNLQREALKALGYRDREPSVGYGALWADMGHSETVSRNYLAQLLGEWFILTAIERGDRRRGKLRAKA